MTLSSLIPVLAIDGPSGTGKGTVGSYIAKTRGWNLLDSGALYRAFAFAAYERGIAPDDVEGICALNQDTVFSFEIADSGEVEIRVNGREISTIVRGEQGGRLASMYAAVPTVRSLLLEHQRNRRQDPGLVADGRDMGTVVFPSATLKVFLTASHESRTQRRYNQLKSKDFDVNLRRLEAQIAERDQQDANRAVAPLVPASDAVVIDTSHRGIGEVVEEVDELLGIRLRDRDGAK
jgi:cytidylate kinase